VYSLHNYGAIDEKAICTFCPNIKSDQYFFMAATAENQIS